MSKSIIECGNGKYKIVNKTGIIPTDNDCIITGFHIKHGKIIKQGKVTFVRGTGICHIKNNIIE
jgi:hypothetical protein